MDRDLLFVVLPLAVLALASLGLALIVRRRWRMDRSMVRRAARLVEPDIVSPPRDPEPASRPWWGNPWVWVAISTAFLVLGFLVWPWLWGGVFLFIPFVWVSRPSTPTLDPRSNGHARREGPV